MIKQIIFFSILGKPLIMYGGMITFLLLFSAAAIPILNKNGITKVPFIWHSRLAKVSLILGLVHGIFGILAFF